MSSKGFVVSRVNVFIESSLLAICGMSTRHKICGRFFTTLLLLGVMGLADGQTPAVEALTYPGAPVTPSEVNIDLRHLPESLSSQIPAERPYRPLLRPQFPPKSAPAVTAESAATPVGEPLAPMPTATANFPGMSKLDSCNGGNCGAGYPPDNNGDVGPNHYIQAVNSSYAIYSKTGTRLAAFTENQLWSTTGSNLCNGNSAGDPIVLYDALADRWILTHFAFAGGSSPFYQCIAASKTGDPVSGGWWMYALRMDPGTTGTPPVGLLNDYGKFGIWNDCLYMAANEFSGNTFAGTLFASFSRSDLYSGNTLTWSLGFINNTVNNPSPFTMIPSHLGGQAAFSLPAGRPNYFVSESTTAWAFDVRKFTPAANCGAGGTFSGATNVSQASYFYPGYPSYAPNVPQPGTATMLDNLGDRLMQKVQYRKVGTQESLWVVHNVQPASGIVTEQWAQIDVTGGTIATTPVQQQIYTPDSTLFRWMGGLAVDGQGNMALGYSTSNSASYPSIAYSGRLASDPLNTLPQTETTLVAGAASQIFNCGGAPCDRWGDYSSMSVDPADDCTFWYTNQYYSSIENGTTNRNWQTGIGSFKFPSCTSSTYILTVTKSGTGTGTVTSSPTGINCGASCVANFASGSSVTLTPVASSGVFTGWSGACVGMGNCVVSMNSPQSVTATFIPPAPPGAPTNITVTAYPGRLQVSFTAPVDTGGSTITGYTVTCTAAGQTTLTNTGTSSPISVYGPTPGVAYSCTVTASNTAGTSTPSTSVTATARSIDLTPILMLLLDD